MPILDLVPGLQELQVGAQALHASGNAHPLTAPADSSLLPYLAAATEAPPASFAQVQSEEQFFGLMKKGIEAGRIHKALLPAFQDFYANYKAAVLSSGRPGADERLVAQIMGAIADRC